MQLAKQLNPVASIACRRLLSRYVNDDANARPKRPAYVYLKGIPILGIAPDSKPVKVVEKWPAALADAPRSHASNASLAGFGSACGHDT